MEAESVVPCLGSQLVILVEGDSIQQSHHESSETCTGELTVVPPFLGGSQVLLNADHYKVYYQVRLHADYIHTYIHTYRTTKH